MGILIIFIILLLVAVGLAAWGAVTHNALGFLGGIIAAVLGVLIFIFSSLNTVGTSDVGIVTAFGKTTGDLAPGIHWVAPWDGVTTWDGSVQTVTYPRGRGCLMVHIGGQQSACLAVTFQYQVRDGAADALFKQYRTQANMNDKLVIRSLDQAINTQLQTFSPIQSMANGNTNGASLVPYEAKIIAQMKGDMGKYIRVESLFIPYAQYDPQTASRLNAYQTQYADTLIAQEAEKTALAQAAAYKTLQHQLGSNSANVVAAQCFNNVMVPLVKNGQVPSGINCWPGSGASTVVVPKP